MSNIKATELRIGNILSYNTGEENEGWIDCVIDHEDIKWCAENPESFNNVHRPILLDKKIFDCFYFNEGNNTYFTRLFDAKHAYSEGEFSINVQFSISVSLYYGVMQIGLGEPFLVAPKYAHSLQNTVRYLTGEELAYTPSKK